MNEHTQERGPKPHSTIDQVRALEPGNFWVKRSPNSGGGYDKGWVITESVTRPGGAVTLRVDNGEGGYKDISGERLLVWQREGDAAAAERDQRLGSDELQRDGAQVLRTVELDENGMIIMPAHAKEGYVAPTAAEHEPTDEEMSHAVSRSKLWERLGYPGPESGMWDVAPAAEAPVEQPALAVESVVVSPTPEAEKPVGDLKSSLDFLARSVTESLLPYADGGISANTLAIRAKVTAQKFIDAGGVNAQNAGTIMDIASEIGRDGYSTGSQVNKLKAVIAELRATL